MTAIATPRLLRADGIGKSYGPVRALRDVSISVERGKVTCLLGDNGAGKSTLIKILSGAIRPDSGQILIEDHEVSFRYPRDASDAGIATVYQDLGLVPLMPVHRNFILGREPMKGWGPLRRIDSRAARDATATELAKVGIVLSDLERPVSTLSGGERQCLAIARASYFGAKLLILDEPTSALGVRQAAIVLRYLAQARKRGIGIVFITHNVSHAILIGDHFFVLSHGRLAASLSRSEVTHEDLSRHMAGGAELDQLEDELQKLSEWESDDDVGGAAS